MPKLYHPQGASSCSFNGQTFEADPTDNGIEVPDEAVEHLLPHGFSTSPPEPAQKKGKS